MRLRFLAGVMLALTTAGTLALAQQPLGDGAEEVKTTGPYAARELRVSTPSAIDCAAINAGDLTSLDTVVFITVRDSTGRAAGEMGGSIRDRGTNAMKAAGRDLVVATCARAQAAVDQRWNQ